VLTRIGFINELDSGREYEDEDGGNSGGCAAIGIAISTFLLYAGYPSQIRREFTHFIHWGLVSSHLTLRRLGIVSSCVLSFILA
jgi:hypothetical protein